MRAEARVKVSSIFSQTSQQSVSSVRLRLQPPVNRAFFSSGFQRFETLIKFSLRLLCQHFLKALGSLAFLMLAYSFWHAACSQRMARLLNKLCFLSLIFILVYIKKEQIRNYIKGSVVHWNIHPCCYRKTTITTHTHTHTHTRTHTHTHTHTHTCTHAYTHTLVVLRKETPQWFSYFV